MGEYKKTTKNDINLPSYCLFFISSLQKELNDTDFEVYDELELEIGTTKFPYCYEALELVIKTFKRKGYIIGTPTFRQIIDENGERKWIYKWLISLINNDDDLPF